MTKAYILTDLNDPSKFKIEVRSQVPSNYVCDAVTKDDKIVPVDELDIYKKCKQTGKRLDLSAAEGSYNWKVAIDVEKQQKKAARQAALEAGLIPQDENGAILKLPSIEDFIVAYLNEKDGNPAQMKKIIKEYILSKRAK